MHTTVEIAVRERPDVCLIDEHLRGGALVAVDAIYRRAPRTRLVVLTASEEPKGLFAAVRAGACGYLRTDLDATRLAATVLQRYGMYVVGNSGSDSRSCSP